MRSGAVEIEQFAEIIKWESEKVSGIRVPEIDFQDVKEIKQDFEDLCKKWNMILENEEIKLIFE